MMSGHGLDLDSNAARPLRTGIASIALIASFAVIAIGCGGTTPAGTNNSDGEDGNDDQRRLEPVELETNVSAEDIKAGQTVDVECQLLDRNGNPVTEKGASFGLITSPSASFVKTDGATTIKPVEAGDATVACTSSSLGFVDQSPAEFSIAPGPAYVTRAELESSRMQAGDTTTASCTVLDEYGNELTSASPEVELDASGEGIDINGTDISITDAGIYDTTCHVDGVMRKVPAPLEVRPGPPTSLMLSTIPDRSLYAVSEVVRFVPTVTDEYGNLIRSADVQFTLSPSGSFLRKFGTGRWEFNREGTYTIDASLQTSAMGGSTLTASTQIRVNSQGPKITCDNPADGGIVEADEGSQITIEGSVSDENGVSELRVDGDTVSVNNGVWNYNTTTKFGVNFLDVEAVDADGKISSTTCAFLAADNWQDPASLHLSDGVSLKMTQDAFDDRTRSGSYNSLADMLVEVLNSQALEDEIDSALYSANSLYDSCVQRVAGVCVYSAQVDYVLNSFSTGMNNSLEVNLVNDGLSADTRVKNLQLEVDIDSSLYNGRVDITADWIDINGLTIEITEQFGQLEASYVKDSENIEFSPDDPTVSTNALGGILDPIINSLAQQEIANLIRNNLKRFIENQFETILNDLFDSLDISSFGQSFDVPSLAGSGSTTLNFGLRFSHAGIDTQRALLGIGTKFRPDTVRYAGRPDRVPLPSGQVRLDPNTSKAIAAGVHVGLLNHALHGLWRGGMFDADLGSAFFGGGAPDGTSVALEMKLPPVADMRKSGGATVSFGGAVVEIVYPGLFDDPLKLRVGARASSDVQLTNNGTELNFQSVSIDQFYFSPVDARLDSDSRAQIESFLRGLFQSVIDSSLNNALPAVPIPSFRIGPTFSTYLPSANANDRLGLKNPTLGQTHTHFTFDGNFGIK